MTSASLVPGQLPERHILPGLVRHRSIHTVLPVSIGAEPEQHLILYRQLIIAKYLPAGGINAFPVQITFPTMGPIPRSEEHTSELQSLMRISSAVFCLKKKKN